MGFLEEETIAVAAAAAALLSPRVRKVARKGAVYGLAGLLRAADLGIAVARGAVSATQPAEAAPATHARPARAGGRPSTRPTRPRRSTARSTQRKRAS